MYIYICIFFFSYIYICIYIYILSAASLAFQIRGKQLKCDTAHLWLWGMPFDGLYDLHWFARPKFSQGLLNQQDQQQKYKICSPAAVHVLVVWYSAFFSCCWRRVVFVLTCCVILNLCDSNGRDIWWLKCWHPVAVGKRVEDIPNVSNFLYRFGLAGEHVDIFRPSHRPQRKYVYIFPLLYVQSEGYGIFFPLAFVEHLLLIG